MLLEHDFHPPWVDMIIRHFLQSCKVLQYMQDKIIIVHLSHSKDIKMKKHCKCGVFKSGPAKDFHDAIMNIKHK